MKEEILVLKKISKYFPGIRALDEVDFKIRTGEVHALVGENGAGKSTLVKIMTGIYQPSSGDIYLNGDKVVFPSPIHSQKAGISAIHQEATMFPELSVLENIFMGHHIKKSERGLLDWVEMRKRTKELLDRLEMDIEVDIPVKNLSVAQRHMVEIAKALSRDARIVIMDEPTSALTLKEVEYLYRIIRKLRAQGRAIIFISHKFEEVFEIAEHFTVLRDGKFIGEGEIKDTSPNEIIRMVVGRTLDKMFPKVETKPGPVVLKVEGLSKPGVFKDVSFELHQGEILGFFGLIGAGRSEIMQTIFGIDPKGEGEIFIKGEQVNIRNPKEAMDKGMAYIPEDRQLQGAILEMTIKDNITLPIVDKLSRFIFLNQPKEWEITEKYGKDMDIKAATWQQLVLALSGGNQQKVVLAKWLATMPEILIMDEPTKGIDVGTKVAVHSIMSKLAKEGIAIILISSELPEIIGMSDRIIVMHEGIITNCLDRKEASSEKIIKAATGILE
ncbi:MAG: sugar ABC transporter ATP-binding protein [Candidatus Caldatribacteriota bacterium]|nr:sugar ABC transporter ATP-binding protein [Atribacterota bacterium]